MLLKKKKVEKGEGGVPVLKCIIDKYLWETKLVKN